MKETNLDTKLQVIIKGVGEKIIVQNHEPRCMKLQLGAT